jgi:hypothetical protein
MSIEINQDLSAAINHLVTSGLLFTPEFQAFHRCDVSCEEPCPRKIRLLGLAAVALDVVKKTIQKLLYPELYNDLEEEMFFVVVMREVWQLHNLGEHPWSRLEPERNVEILATMHALAMEALERDLFFMGWRG